MLILPSKSSKAFYYCLLVIGLAVGYRYRRHLDHVFPQIPYHASHWDDAMPTSIERHGTRKSFDGATEENTERPNLHLVAGTRANVEAARL